MRIAFPLVLLALCCSATTLPAQEKLKKWPRHSLQLDGQELFYRVREPEQPGRDGFRPLVLVCVVRGDDFGYLNYDPLVPEGFVVAYAEVRFMHDWTDRKVAGSLLARLPAMLRQKYAIAGGGIHLVADNATAEQAMDLALARPWEFRSLTFMDVEPPEPTGAISRLRGRTVAWYEWSQPPELQRFPQLIEQFERHGVKHRYLAWPLEADPQVVVQRHLRALAAELVPDGPAGEVAHALDRFHDAAAKADEDAYFALLPDDAVFLGTDATERWTGAEFRQFAMPWFQRESAWVYVPFARHVTMLGDDLAMFDELLDNEAYGECRGSGVMQRRDGRWVLRQYDLSVPMPNALARSFVAQIRRFAAGEEPRRTTVVVVRHAEKEQDAGADPWLTEEGKARADRLARMLADLPVKAVFATEYRRTRATVAPLARARELELREVKAADTKGLARTLKGEFAGDTVVVAAHSNTIPALLQELGVADPVTIADDDYTGLFVVTLDDAGARLLRLHY